MLKNDKSTYKDELILALIVVVCLGVGVLLTVTAPSFWIIKSSMTKLFGVFVIILGIMFFISLIWRLFSNDRKH